MRLVLSKTLAGPCICKPNKFLSYLLRMAWLRNPSQLCLDRYADKSPFYVNFSGMEGNLYGQNGPFENGATVQKWL